MSLVGTRYKENLKKGVNLYLSKKGEKYERFWNCVHYYFGAMFFMTACVPNQILLVTHLSPARKFALWRILTNFCHVKIVTILENIYLPLADHEAITEREDNKKTKCHWGLAVRIQIWLAMLPNYIYMLEIMIIIKPSGLLNIRN
ncbi:hypothetical protein ACJX0J_015575 [Zea mays]